MEASSHEYRDPELSTPRDEPSCTGYESGDWSQNQYQTEQNERCVRQHDVPRVPADLIRAALKQPERQHQNHD